jgi:hypothetical protein
MRMGEPNQSLSQRLNFMNTIQDDPFFKRQSPCKENVAPLSTITASYDFLNSFNSMKPSSSVPNSKRAGGKSQFYVQKARVSEFSLPNHESLLPMTDDSNYADEEMDDGDSHHLKRKVSEQTNSTRADDDFMSNGSPIGANTYGIKRSLFQFNG